MAIRRERDTFYIDESCYINTIHTNENVTSHTHDFLELVYICKGRSLQYIDNTAYPVSAGDMLFINFGCKHRFEASGNFSYADIIIKPEFISESLAGTDNAFALLELESFKEFNKTVNRNDHCIHFDAKERRQIESLIELVCAEQKQTKPGKNLVLHALFNTLLTLVFRKMTLPMKEDAGIGARLLAYIQNNCGERLSLEQIAVENHYTPAYFSRLFKKQTGYTFTEYLLLCRCERACTLLRETDLRVGDIAAEVGFSDRTKFFKAFAQHTGTTPLKFRKEQN